MATTENSTPGWFANIVAKVNELLRKYPDIIRLMFITFAVLEIADFVTDCLFLELIQDWRSSFYDGCRYTFIFGDDDDYFSIDDDNHKSKSVCNSLNSIAYVTIFLVFPVTAALFAGKTLLAIMEVFSAKTTPVEKMLAKIEIPGLNVLYLLTLSQSTVHDLYECNSKRQSERNDSLVMRIFGLHNSRALLCYKVPIGWFTFFPCFMNSESRKHLKGKKTRLWRVLLYPVLLPFTCVYWNALSIGGIIFFLPSCIITGLFSWLYAPSLFIPNIIIYGDHAVTIRYFEDLPQSIMGFYYNKISHNKTAVLSSVISLILLGKTTLELIYFEIKNWNSVREKKAVDQIAIMDIYGPLKWYEAIYLTIITPVFVYIYFIWFLFFYGIKYISLMFLCFPKCHDGMFFKFHDDDVDESKAEEPNAIEVELSNPPSIKQGDTAPNNL